MSNSLKGNSCKARGTKDSAILLVRHNNRYGELVDNVDMLYFTKKGVIKYFIRCMD
ncbi:hypothetical protein PAE4_20265 [Bacillus altitudinis]|nr:hypothetical protein PAE4_20265 [Bacillus altitudinis]